MKKKLSINIMLHLRLNAVNYVLTVKNFLIALVLLVSKLKEKKTEVLQPWNQRLVESCVSSTYIISRSRSRKKFLCR